MNIYNYDKDSKELISQSVASINPLEVGKFLVPANATTKEPLETKDGFAVCFKEDEWVYVVDNRDKTYYENKELVVFELGDEITSDMSLEQYTDEELLQQAKDKKIALIDTQTANDIEVLIGDNNKQKDLLATYNYLLEKKFDGDITVDETTQMTDIKTKWFQVAQLKNSGNAKETEVSALLLVDYETLEEAILSVEAL